MQKYVPLVKQNVMKLEVFILGGQIRRERRDGGEREDREGERDREDRDREKRDKKETS